MFLNINDCWLAYYQSLAIAKFCYQVNSNLQHSIDAEEEVRKSHSNKQHFLLREEREREVAESTQHQLNLAHVADSQRRNERMRTRDTLQLSKQIARDDITDSQGAYITYREHITGLQQTAKQRASAQKDRHKRSMKELQIYEKNSRPRGLFGSIFGC